MKRKLFALVAILAMLITSADLSYAKAPELVVPEQTITGADEVYPLGELVDLRISPIEKDKIPQHLVAVSYEWKIFDFYTGEEKRVRFTPDNNSVFFGAGILPKKLRAYCAVTYLYVIKTEVDNEGKKEIETEAATRTLILSADIKIGSENPPKPGPKPGPKPTPPPTPDFAPGKYGLAKSVYELAVKDVKDVEALKKGGEALATSFRGNASAIAAGTVSRPEDILTQTTNSNRTALERAGVSKDTWTPCFTEMTEVIYELYNSSKISTKSDFQTAWNEIAEGLEALKKYEAPAAKKAGPKKN